MAPILPLLSENVLRPPSLPQSLFLLNNPFPLAQAEAIAAIASAEGITAPEPLAKWLWRRLFQREPNPGRNGPRPTGSWFPNRILKTLTSFCQMLLCSNEIAYGGLTLSSRVGKLSEASPMVSGRWDSLA